MLNGICSAYLLYKFAYIMLKMRLSYTFITECMINIPCFNTQGYNFVQKINYMQIQSQKNST